MEEEHTKEPSHNNPEEAANYVKAVNMLLQSFVHATNALLSIFSLGKGRESLHLKPYEKLITSAFSDLSPARTELDKTSTMHLKIAQNMYIFYANFAPFQ